MNNILISYRVRLARNLRDLPFPARMDEGQIRSLLDRASGALIESAGGNEFKCSRFTASGSLEACAMMERHLISHEFFSSDRPRAVVANRDRSVSVMINEEDHLRIQVFGKFLNEAWKTALNIDRLLDEKLNWAFDEELGYLTACPTNLGTGLRASALMHLPALTELGAMRDIINQASQLGMTVRGLYGEGTSAQWGYYQISNQVTLGVTEESVLARLQEVADAVAAHETGARAELKKRDPVGLADRVYRAYGLLSNARRISTPEAMGALAVLRMGGPVTGFDFGGELADELLHAIQPAVITLAAGRGMTEQARDEARADLLRDKVAEIPRFEIDNLSHLEEM